MDVDDEVKMNKEEDAREQHARKEQIKEKLLELKHHRNLINSDQKIYDDALEQFKLEHESVLKSIDTFKKGAKEIEQDLRSIGEAYYNSYDEKSFFGMKVTRKLNVPSYDKDKAIAYCIERKDAQFLNLNKSKFDEAVKVLKPDFATFKDEVSVSVPKIIEVE